MHMLVRKTHYMILCSMNTELTCSHSNNINHHKNPRMIPEELKLSLPLHFCICSEICEVQTTLHQKMSLNDAMCPPCTSHLPWD